jgi:hypothetical protein
MCLKLLFHLSRSVEVILSIIDTIKSAIGMEDRTKETVGTIVDGPMLVRDEHDESHGEWVFRLDTHPGIEFRQAARPLASERRRGDRVQVHYQMVDDNTAAVEWVEGA